MSIDTNDDMARASSPTKNTAGPDNNIDHPMMARPPKHYYPTCHINGGGVASLMLSCCAPGLGDFTAPAVSPLSYDHAATAAAGSDAANKDTLGDNVKTSSSNGENEGDGANNSKGNFWSDKEKKTNQLQLSNQQQMKQNTNAASDFPNLGMPQSKQQKKQNKPFASTTLLDRADSLVHQSSLLSLIATESEVGSPSSLDDDDTATVHSALPTENITYASFINTPERTSQPITNHTPTQQQLPMPPPPSPALELSMARLEANTIANINQSGKKNRRLNCSGGSVGSASKINAAVAALARTLPTHSENIKSSTANSGIAKGLEKNYSMGSNENDKSVVSGTVSLASVALSTLNSNSNTNNISMHTAFGKSDPPPTWTSEGVNSELNSTYRYPRLYLKDPVDVMEGLAASAASNATTQPDSVEGIKEVWWFHLARKMDTTLDHVLDNHWKSIAKQQLHQYKRHSSSSDSISAASSNLEGNGLSVGQNGCNADALVDLCSSATQQPSQPQHKKSKSWSSHKSKTSNAPLTYTTESATATTPINCWSEPSASTLKVRGPTYSQDGVKVESDVALFACLGVDSFVNGSDRNENDSSKLGAGTKSFLERWERACEEIGLEKAPFL